MRIVFCTCSLFRKLATLAGRARIHSHLYTSHLRLAILVPFPAPSLRNPHFATPRALAPQSLRPFLRYLRNPHLLSFANRRIVSPISPLSHKLVTLSGR